MANGTKVIESVKPIRVKPSVAAKMLGVGYDEILKMIHRGMFTVFDNKKRGITRRIHLLTEEVETYGHHGEDALRDLRARKKRARR